MGPIFQVERATFEIIPSNKSLARFLSKVKTLKYMFLYKISFLIFPTSILLARTSGPSPTSATSYRRAPATYHPAVLSLD